ncbi:MAG TPA: DNA replication and repair protein RecF [Candidatus Polarisedimenticolaceae bacterium]|nr:DNA replication and repair protein RecF [Candidatus Polarisedimenticolaceae bacterium]
MWLTTLEADRLRNLRAVRLSLGSGLTVIAGRNGEGKSSLLEAVYLLSTGRSFRTRKAEELIAWSGGPLRVAGVHHGRLGPTEIKVILDGAERRLIVDGVERDQESFLGRLDVVDLTGERMQVLRGAPEERRRFLDRGIVGLRPSYLRSLGEYRRVLHQRNALLRRRGKGGGPGFATQLDSWDERLVRAAREIHAPRRSYAVHLGAELGETTRALFPGGGELHLVYRPSPAALAETEPNDFEQTYAEALERGRPRDLALGHTCRGPHRDELAVELDGVDLRRFGSAGQVRSAMIALKLGKLSRLAKERGETPIFLMDDFDSDIDEVRAEALADFLRRGGFQALVATSKERMADRIGAPFTKVVMTEGTIRTV